MTNTLSDTGKSNRGPQETLTIILAMSAWKQFVWVMPYHFVDIPCGVGWLEVVQMTMMTASPSCPLKAHAFNSVGACSNGGWGGAFLGLMGVLMEHWPLINMIERWNLHSYERIWSTYSTYMYLFAIMDGLLHNKSIIPFGQCW